MLRILCPILCLVYAASAEAAPKPCLAGTFASPGDKWRGGKSPYLRRLIEPDDFGVAHRRAKLGSYLKITNARTGLSVVAQVIDRGPYWAVPKECKKQCRKIGKPMKPLSKGWRHTGCVDLTPPVARAIAARGLEMVIVEPISFGPQRN